MKKIGSFFITLGIMLVMIFGLAGCGNDAKPTSYYINNEGNLIVVLDDGKENDLGEWGEDIILSLGEITVSSDGYYVINGVKTDITTKVPDFYTINNNGHLIVTYLDGSTADLGLIGDSLVNGVSNIQISEDGFYVVNGVKTNISAINVYTVSFDTGFSTKVQNQKVKEGYKVEKPSISRTGYKFDGWFYNDEEWLFNSNTVTSDMTLVAHWTANAYTVKFNNTKGDNPEDAIYKYDSNVTLPKVPNVDGYTMCGWYNGNTLVSNGKWNIADDVTLTTKWTANNYTITLDPNGGSVSSTTMNIAYGENYTLPVPTNDFGAFKGWYYGDEKITDAAGNSLSPFTYTSNITLTTNWIEEISTVEQLKAIANGLNGHYKLVANIDLENEEWAPIGNASSSFTGVLDGNGHTISNFKVSNQSGYIGLIGYNKGTIKNLIITGTDVNVPTVSHNSYVGTIAGYNKGTIENVQVSGSLIMNSHSSSYTTYIGGIAGYNEGAIKNSTNNTSVTGINYVGGITAYNKGTLLGLTNKGIIIADTYGAGITAFTTTGISECINEGNITAGSHTAGIVASILGGNSITISKCKNTGDLNTQSYAGGIIGYNNGSSSYITISQCVNTGNITSSVNDEYLGGIAGFIYSVYISDSYNIGNVIGGDRTGGIIGYAWNGSVTNCYAAGTLKSHTGRTGGIAGIFQRGSFNECYTNVVISGGVITGTINGNETDSSSLSNCYYSGSCTFASSYLTQGTNTTIHYDKAFYTDYLFWSDSIWNFSGTTYPTLKWEAE